MLFGVSHLESWEKNAQYIQVFAFETCGKISSSDKTLLKQQIKVCII